MEQLHTELTLVVAENERPRVEFERLRNNRRDASQEDVGYCLYYAVLREFQTFNSESKLPKFEEDARNTNKFLEALQNTLPLNQFQFNTN